MATKRILVVESDPKVSRMFCDFFTLRGCDVDPCTDGREAFRLAMLQDYDLVTVNVKMPEMDGALVVESITMVKPFARIVLVTAAFDSDENIKHALQKAAGLVKLPFKPEELDRLVAPLGV